MVIMGKVMMHGTLRDLIMRNQAIETALYHLWKAADRIWPKDNLILICSNNGDKLTGSSLAFFEYLEKDDTCFEVGYYLPYEKAEEGVIPSLFHMLKAAPLFLRSRVLILGGDNWDCFPFLGWSRKKLCIDLWHGTPLKNIEILGEPSDHPFRSDKKKIRHWSRLDKLIDIRIVASKLEGHIISQATMCDPRKIVILGHPRHDWLFEAQDFGVRDLLPDIPESSKLILYAPTYRGNSIDRNPTEGARLFPFEGFNREELERFLAENDAYLLYRMHFYEEENLEESERVRYFGPDLCNEVTKVLPNIDVLITDYSSIYIDYLLLNRPCIFIPYDLEDYQRTRGMVFDDYDFWTPGPKVYDWEGFKSSLQEAFTNPLKDADRRETVRSLLIKDVKGSRSEGLYHFIMKSLKENHRLEGDFS